MDTIIIVADLGCFKAYRVSADEDLGSSTVRLVEDENGDASEAEASDADEQPEEETAEAPIEAAANEEDDNR